MRVSSGRLYDSANIATMADRVGRQGGTGFQREAGRTARSGPAQTRRAVGRVPQALAATRSSRTNAALRSDLG